MTFLKHYAIGHSNMLKKVYFYIFVIDITFRIKKNVLCKYCGRTGTEY